MIGYVSYRKGNEEESTQDRIPPEKVPLGCEEPEGRLWNMASEQRTESAELSGLDYDRIRLLQRSILGQSIQYERDTIRV